MEHDILYKYFNRETSKEEEMQIADWLDISNENQTLFQKEREYYNMALLLADEEQITNSKRTKLIPYWLKEIGKVAAVILIMLGIGFYYQWSTLNKLERAMNVVSVPAGQRVNIVLPDGTHICMNAKSKLEYPSSFVGGSRKVKLSGEAYFTVTHDETKPFVVETNGYNIEVLGTTFNVESYTNTNDFSTSLIEGKVRITDKSDETNHIVLEPSQQAKIVNNKLVASSINDFEVLRWREGLICFKDKPFKQLAEQFEKYYEVRIIIENENLLKHELSGKIRISDGIEHALRVIQKNTSFSYYRDPKMENVIYIK